MHCVGCPSNLRQHLTSLACESGPRLIRHRPGLSSAACRDVAQELAKLPCKSVTMQPPQALIERLAEICEPTVTRP